MTDRQAKTIELQAIAVRFFSAGDEAAFFGWLHGLPCVERVEGRGSAVYVSVDGSAVDEEGLRELLAAFRRYGVSLSQFVAFDREEFADWFRRDSAYWHEEVFG